MDTIDTRDASLTDAERADIYLDIIARIRDHLMSVRDSVAEEWMAEVVAFPSSVIGLAEARMQQLSVNEGGQRSQEG